MKILAVASGGGHWVQLLRLVPAFHGFDVAYVSIDPTPPADIAGHRYYSVRDVTRRNGLGFAVVAAQMARILLRERPDAVITTGAAPGLMAIALARYLTRSRTIWIDSIANVEQLSLSGTQARRFADVWLTQWEHLARPEGPQYLGQVL